MSEDILLQVRKPARYIGQEWNSSRKDFGDCQIKFGLCFPDLYEVGMSNLGLRIIYALLNEISDVSCERFFAPGLDMENILRNSKSELFSLETKRKLREFDLIGFSLSYELCYTNVLNMLELGAIPLKSALRDHNWPLVIAGGPCTLNPEPMHEFFDLFVIGEAEEVILEIVNTYRNYKDNFKSGKISKQDLLIILAGIEGVYVPSLYELTYNSQGKIEKFKPKTKGIPKKIKKRFIRDLDNAIFPLDWLVPYIEIIHDRIILEIMRGCPNQCRFCQARQQYHPFRKRNAEKILTLAIETYKRSGYEELSLAGLSVSDYPCIEELARRLIDTFKEKGVAVSLPSIKPKANVGSLSSIIAGIKKTSLTFAPEAATEKLRQLLNKNFDADIFFKALEESYLSGYRRVKLYFMIGLPGETDSDLDGIIDFANRASQIRRKSSRLAASVNVSINALIPKPHTALQWVKMEDTKNIQYKQDYLKKKIKNKKIELNFHNRNMSFLEGVLSRGDRRLSSVILAAFKKGARFDAWENYFALPKWLQAFQESGINPDFYLEAKSQDEILAWDFLDIGIDKEALIADFNKLSENISYGALYQK
jgi:radical SAM family uncharacterized protein